jgi:O-antigen/teichoic acid export membrane protein
VRKSGGTYVGTRLLTRNTVLNLVGQAAPLLVAVATIPLLVSAIGADRFGLLVIAWAVLGYFSLFDMGLGRSLTQLVAERLGDAREGDIPALARTALSVMAVMGLFGAAALYALAPVLTLRVLNIPPEIVAETLTALRLLAFAVPFVVVTAGLRGILEAIQWFGWVNAIRIPQGVLTYLGPLVVLPFSRSLTAMVGALVVVRLVVWIGYGLVCLRAFPELRNPLRDRRGTRGGTHAMTRGRSSASEVGSRSATCWARSWSTWTAS